MPGILSADIGPPAFGVAPIATITSICLFGVITFQCWKYFSRFRSDPMMLRLTILFVWISTLLRVFLGTQGSHLTTPKGWSDASALLQANWSIRAIMVLNITIMLLTHIFFAHKIWTLFRKAWLIPTLLITASIAEFGYGMNAFVFMVLTRHFHDFEQADDYARKILRCAPVVDWVITLSLGWMSKEQLSMTDQKITEMIKTIASYTASTGLLISLVDLAVLAKLNANYNPYALFSVSLYEILGSLYATSLLACLNSRPLISEMMGRSIDMGSVNLSPEVSPIALAENILNRRSNGDMNHTLESDPYPLQSSQEARESAAAADYPETSIRQGGLESQNGLLRQGQQPTNPSEIPDRTLLK